MQIHPLFFTTVLLAASIPSSLAQTGNKSEFSRERPYPTEANLFQVSTLGALEAAVLEGAYPIGLLTYQGNFGVGHYVGLGGELIALDGHFYYAYSTGLVEEAQDSELVPFAVVPYLSRKRV